MCNFGHAEEEHDTKSGSCIHADDGTKDACVCAGFEEAE